MSIIVDRYRINWARRYIREADADLSIAESDPLNAVSKSFALRAMRKSQIAVYYSLGVPERLASLVNQSIDNGTEVDDTAMHILVQMERLIQKDNRQAERLNKKVLIEEARFLLEIASKIVDLVIDERDEHSA